MEYGLIKPTKLPRINTSAGSEKGGNFSTFTKDGKPTVPSKLQNDIEKDWEKVDR